MSNAVTNIILLSFPFAKIKSQSFTTGKMLRTVQFSRTQMMIYHAEYLQLRCNLRTHTHTYTYVLHNLLKCSTDVKWNVQQLQYRWIQKTTVFYMRRNHTNLNDEQFGSTIRNRQTLTERAAPQTKNKQQKIYLWTVVLPY